MLQWFQGRVDKCATLQLHVYADLSNQGEEDLPTMAIIAISKIKYIVSETRMQAKLAVYDGSIDGDPIGGSVEPLNLRQITGIQH